MCSSMQQGVGTMVDDIEQTVKIGNQVNNAGMTAGRKTPDSTQNLIEAKDWKDGVLQY